MVTLVGVRPYLAQSFSAIQSFAAKYRISVSLVSGLRTAAEQNALYSAGKTTAKPGTSQHEYGLAIDIGVSPAAALGSVRSIFKALGFAVSSEDPNHIAWYPREQWRAILQQNASSSREAAGLGVSFGLSPSFHERD